MAYYSLYVQDVKCFSLFISIDHLFFPFFKIYLRPVSSLCFSM